MADTQSSNRIAYVIILYWPDDETVDFISALANEGVLIVAVVNDISPSADVKLSSLALSKIIYSGHNVGLARALNNGCEFAFGAGASHVFLLDQDSRPDTSLPEALLADSQTAENSGVAVGVIAPILIDVKSEHYEAAYQKSNDDLPAVSDAETVATSGSLISKEAFQSVGAMYDWLFIDDIDHEWCFRARRSKLAVLRANKRTMLHDMGDHGLTLFGRYRPLHRSPVRHRYIIRNTVFMIRQPYVDWRWRLREAIKTIYRIPVYISISEDRKSTFNGIISGLIEGLRHKRDPKID